MNQLCTFCSHPLNIKGESFEVVICTKCNNIVINNSGEEIAALPMHDDWSIIKLGTTGEYKSVQFEVIGRVRMQLRSGYRNNWFLWHEKNRTYGWLSESMGTYTICAEKIFDLDKREEIKKIKAGNKVKVAQTETTLIVSLVDKCEEVTYEGQLSYWKDFSSPYFTAEAQNAQGISMFYIINSSKQKAGFMLGDRVDLNSLKLQSTHKFNDWK